MNIEQLSAQQLDYWVAQAEGVKLLDPVYGQDLWLAIPSARANEPYAERWSPSTLWHQGGPLIEKHELTLIRWKYEVGEYDYEQGRRDFWGAFEPCASHYLDVYRSDWDEYPFDRGDTALQVVCRIIVKAKFGDEVDAPQTYQQEK